MSGRGLLAMMNGTKNIAIKTTHTVAVTGLIGKILLNTALRTVAVASRLAVRPLIYGANACKNGVTAVVGNIGAKFIRVSTF